MCARRRIYTQPPPGVCPPCFPLGDSPHPSPPRWRRSQSAHSSFVIRQTLVWNRQRRRDLSNVSVMLSPCYELQGECALGEDVHHGTRRRCHASYVHELAPGKKPHGRCQTVLEAVWQNIASDKKNVAAGKTAAHSLVNLSSRQGTWQRHLALRQPRFAEGSEAPYSDGLDPSAAVCAESSRWRHLRTTFLAEHTFTSLICL